MVFNECWCYYLHRGLMLVVKTTVYPGWKPC